MGRKKLVVIESDEGLPEGFITQNLLKEPDNEKCLIPKANLEIIKKNHAMLYETIFFTHSDLTSECYSPTWVCFPEYPFVIGLKFPFPDLITKFFSYTKLNYAQLMPQGWRYLQTLVKLGERADLTVGLEELAYTVDLRGFGPGRFGFRVKSGEPILISNHDPADRGWKNKFFFARRDTLGHEEGVISKWRFQEVSKLSDLFPGQEGTQENVNQLLKLGISDRTFKAFPVEFSVEEVEGEAEIEGEAEVEPEENLPPNLPEMSTATRSKSNVSAADLMAAAKAKRIAKKESKPPTPMSMASSSELNASKKKEEAKKRKLSEVEAMDTNDDCDTVKAQKKLKDAIAYFVDKVADIMCPIMDQFDALKIKAAKYNYEAEGYKKQATKNAGEVEELKKNLETEKKELEVVRAEKVKENEAHEKELDAAKEDFKFNATKAVFEARIELMEEYKNGLAPAWDVEEEKRSLEDFIGEPADVGEVNYVALEALVDDARKALSTIVVARVEEKEYGKENNATPAAAGQV